MDYDDAYANRAYIPDADSYLTKWEEAAHEWRSVENAVGRAQLNVPYGNGEREVFDIFYPASGKPKGLLVFVHGGYWMAFDNKSWSHLAAGATARGWAVLMPSYTLAPEARISEITQQIVRAIEVAAKTIAGPIVLTGHSAGGHLVARMLCADAGLGADVVKRLQKVVPISPVSDLRPLLHTKMNDVLQLDAKEAAAESPLLAKTIHPVPIHVWVGGAERPVFLDQARWLAKAWDNTGLTIVPARHHFDVIDELADEGSALIQTLLD